MEKFPVTGHTNVFLKAGITSLAQQARIMRRLEQEQRSKRVRAADWGIRHGMSSGTNPLVKELNHEAQVLSHQRRVGLRQHVRAMNLAYGFIRGRTYREMEQKTYSSPDWLKVVNQLALHHKVDERVWRQRLAQWLDEGGVVIPKAQVDFMNSVRIAPSSSL